MGFLVLSISFMSRILQFPDPVIINTLVNMDTFMIDNNIITPESYRDFLDQNRPFNRATMSGK